MLARTALWIAVAALVAPGTAGAASGDTDAFGYTARSSTDGGSPYSYTSVTSGTYRALLDEDFRTVQLPFPFTFYGTSHGSVDIHSNGALTFGASGFLPWDRECGGLLSLSPRIWVWYDDLDPTDIPLVTPLPGVYSSVVGEAPDRVFVVEWFQIPLYEVADPLSFEVKLFETDGRVELHFADTQTSDGSRNGGATAAVGISNADSDPLLFSCDQAVLSAGFAVTFYPPCDDVDGDGFCPGPAPDPEDRDCDDTDRHVHPGAEERCNAIDDDCDGDVPDDERDGDGDDEAPCAGDCDDEEATVHSGAEEVCNEVDDDCDGEADEDLDCDPVDDDDAADDDTTDDDDAAGGIPYGCLVRCSGAGPVAPPGALAALAVILWTGRRRRDRADPVP